MLLWGRNSAILIIGYVLQKRSNGSTEFALKNDKQNQIALLVVKD